MRTIQKSLASSLAAIFLHRRELMSVLWGIKCRHVPFLESLETPTRGPRVAQISTYLLLQAIQRRDSYYWEDDSVEVTPVLVLRHNLHWIGAQLLSGRFLLCALARQ